MTISVAPSVSAPALAGWRTITAALACALLIGGIGGLIGLGGGEFRLPLLVGLIGFNITSKIPPERGEETGAAAQGGAGQ